MDFEKMFRIAVIGAGSCGVAAVKECLAEGLDVVCFEQFSDLGGIWWYREEPVENTTTVMKCTVTNSSKELSSYSDFVPREELPAYLPHHQMLQYVREYCDHFGVTEKIRFNCKVLHIFPLLNEPKNTTKWSIRYVNKSTNVETTEYFDAVMICVGHHNIPRKPKFRNQENTKCEVMVAQQYKNPEPFAEKNVLVVGMGNSACDSACDLSTVANKVFLSYRSANWIYPLHIRGRPLDSVFLNRFNKCLSYVVPTWFAERKMRKICTDALDHLLFGLNPQHSVLKQQATINSEIGLKFLDGTVKLRPEIDHLKENSVVFVDGQEEDVDVIISCFGYDIDVPFIDSKYFSRSEEGYLNMYKLIYCPELEHPDTLGYLGLVQAVGNLQQVFEMQARHFVQTFLKRHKLPSKDIMLRDIRRRQNIMKQKFLRSERYIIQEDKVQYMDELASDINVKPNFYTMFFTDFLLWKACVFGSYLAYQYRLVGPGSWSGARDAIMNFPERELAFLRHTKRNDNNVSAGTSNNDFVACCVYKSAKFATFAALLATVSYYAYNYYAIENDIFS